MIDVVVHADGSVAVVDDGRGTGTRRDDGVWWVKPAMATADLRFHDVDDVPTLPDGLPRRGVSVVAAVCPGRAHQRASRGAWTARYDRGLPISVPQPISAEGRAIGTTVRLWPDPDVFGVARLDVPRIVATMSTIETTASITVREVWA